MRPLGSVLNERTTQMPDLDTTARPAGRYPRSTPEQLRARTAAASAARKSAAEKIAELEARFEDQIGTLRAEVADLRQRVAA